MILLSVIVAARAHGDGTPLCDSLVPRYLGLCDGLELIEVTKSKSMGAAYNQGFLRSRGDWLLFAHTDVIVTGWMSVPLFCSSLPPHKIGFLGVAGTQTLNQQAVWWGPPHSSRSGKVNDFNYGPCSQVVVLDGCFLLTTRAVLAELYPWNEGLSWHFYDLDMTLCAHLAGYKNYTVPISITHTSPGSTGPDWEQSRQYFLDRYGSLLPISVSSQSEETVKP